MTLENSIKDVIAKKMEDGTIEKLVEEHFEKGVKNALDSLFRSYGDITKVIEAQVKSVMVPYLEHYDYSKYLVKLDSVLREVLKNSTRDNKNMLENFKGLMLPVDQKTINTSELYEIWRKYVAEEVKTDGLEINYDDDISYEPVEVTLYVNYEDDRSWRSIEYATLVFECEHDEALNFAIRLDRWNGDKDTSWSMSYDSIRDIRSLRYLNEFEILLMRLSQAGTKLIMDTDSENDEITPEKQPEPTYE